jgi:PhzF family phenazine biosynthesis protein
VTAGVTAPLFCVDAFTAEPFAGNPAAICLLESPLPEPRMRAIAAELNLSETAFVVPGDDHYALRWFTPTQEVELCGHATLASAHVLYETGRAPRDASVRFSTRWRGVLIATSADDGVALDFPAAPSQATPAPPGLAAALGAEPVAVGVNDLHHIAELADEATVRALAPDFDALAHVEGVEAVTVTARGDDEGADFVSRYFAPRHGITEDPVTGSAHTSLAPWWAERLGKNALVGIQLSDRTGIVHVQVDAPTPGRVTLSGQAVTIWQGDLLV